VGLVEHVRGIESRQPPLLGVHQLVEDQEELEGLDGAGVQVVVAVFAVVEVEAGQLPNWISRATIISMFTLGAWWPRSTSEKARSPSSRTQW
jgi:hypothetical protein